MKWQTAVVATAFVIASSASARAQKSTDVVTLLNGDRMTGEILNLNRGRLELKTDDAGTINIEWDKIASVDTAIKRELWKDFFLSLNVYDTFDSEPPQPDSSRNDLGVSFSIGWSY